ncbi:hypothetical protein BDY19DRAFT_1035200 [Irpex rosettiformis]|uniref:Uncharacterized protein n=1 Tax=Irpex rosettiformis TaxID=378272 RepID=A0ACB8U921_9APHY|nr:hypothetical protein BDY19DRAFT_1035200 [Irpex rosettiformis]
MINSLTREASVKLGPILLETLLRHYFDRIIKDNTSQDKVLTQLRKDELLYDEAFIVVKMFLEAASKHTVEEVQQFANTRTPSPPSVLVVKVLIPMPLCDAAADIVIKALGGEEMTKKMVGGTKWWQVRGLKGVDGEWMVAKKDWHEAEKRYKSQEKQRASFGKSGRKSNSAPTIPVTDPEKDVPSSYDPDMDEMRCILYTHGGGYYFGSVDQERYAIQRFARKINGRVFAINYRLAPQYPFPCALQDIIAAYLFLIRPPEGALHRPVNPAHIVVAGDSAGGGLTIALLQVIRDCGLPMPAGGFLISPWCDLTHSFPSIHTNTATDVIPPWGLSFQKPSTLWPPPPDELSTRVRENLRSRIHDAISLTKRSRHNNQIDGITPESGQNDVLLPQTGRTLHLGSTASLPMLQSDVRDQALQCTTSTGQVLRVEEQVHMYTPNHLLDHPLVSPVMSYLGGLPPLLVIAGDGEVLRDEVIYMAHKAANPAKFPIRPETREIYPALKGMEGRHGPTQIHLQVYDDAAHILPILFSFTTPAKYCFRAIATFIRHVSGTSSFPHSESSINIRSTLPSTPTPGLVVSDNLTLSPVGSRASGQSSQIRPKSSTANSHQSSRDPSPRPRGRSLFTKSSETPTTKDASDASPNPDIPRKKSLRLRRALSAHVSRASGIFKGAPKLPDFSVEDCSKQASNGQASKGKTSGDVGGPRFYGSGTHEPGDGMRRAGEASVYDNPVVSGILAPMIRERVSTRGVIRPLEPEDQLSAFSLPPELIGVFSELAIRRYIDAKAKFGKKFSKAHKTVEKSRHKHLAIAKKNAVRNMVQLQSYLEQENREGSEIPVDGLVSSGSWAWALDVEEKPPASSIAARRDTREAVQLARIADQSVLAEESIMSGNSLWTLMANFLTTTPGKKSKHHHSHSEDDATTRGKQEKEKKTRSRFAQLVSDGKKRKETS